MMLWIDDERPPPHEGWTWVKTDTEAMNAWEWETPTTISFDHDLGMVGGDTRALATAILRMAQSGQREPPRWYVHSANPVGVEWLTGVLESADRYWRHTQTKKHLAASYKRRKQE